MKERKKKRDEEAKTKVEKGKVNEREGENTGENKK